MHTESDDVLMLDLISFCYKLIPSQLDSVNWRLNLQLAQSNRTKMKKTNAFFELGLKTTSSEVSLKH